VASDHLRDEKLQNSSKGEHRPRWYSEGFYSTRSFGEDLAAGFSSRSSLEYVFLSNGEIEVVSLRELDSQIQTVAANLFRIGIRSGDVVALQTPHRREGLIALHAIIRLGSIPLPLIHNLGFSELNFILRQSQASAVVMPDRWRNINFLERIVKLDVPSIKHFIVIGSEIPLGAIAWTELEEANGLDFETPDNEGDDPFMLLYTSGSTAQPKGVLHSHNTIRAELHSPALRNQGSEHGIHLGAGPAGHIGGTYNQMRLSLYGLKMVLMDAWDAVAAATLVHDFSVTGSSGTPFFLSGLLDAAEEMNIDVSSLVNYQLGSAPVPRALVERATARGMSVYRAWGSTEFPTGSTTQSDTPLEKLYATDGRPTPGVTIKILDSLGEKLPIGVDGEIFVRGPQLFCGYLDDSSNSDRGSLVERVKDVGEWFNTGDVGHLDDEGYLTLTGRTKDIIIRGGENISASELEEALLEYPRVREAAVIALPDLVYGEKACAVLVMKSGSEINLDLLRDYFDKSGLARHKIPERLELMSELPRNPFGKLNKSELRAKFGV